MTVQITDVHVGVPSTVKLKLNDAVPSELVTEHEKMPVSVNVRFETVSVDVMNDEPSVELIVYLSVVSMALPFNHDMVGTGRPVAVQVNCCDSPRMLVATPALALMICGLWFAAGVEYEI